jgi:hypothetical protein
MSESAHIELNDSTEDRGSRLADEVDRIGGRSCSSGDVQALPCS